MCTAGPNRRMPTASQGVRAGWWPLYTAIADEHVRPRATSAKAAADRRPFSDGQSLRAPPRNNRKAGAAPQFSRKISWEEHLRLLKQYVAREGDARVPLEHEESGVRLGVWLSKQWAEFQSDTRGGYLSRDRR